MEKNSSFVKARSKSISWGVLAILLCVVTCAFGLTVGPGESVTIDYLLEDFVTVQNSGTLNMDPGAQVWGITAQVGSIVNFYAGEVLWGGVTDVADSAVVTVYGTELVRSEDTPSTGLTTVTGYYENDAPINLIFALAEGATLTLSPPGGTQPENTPPVADAGPDIFTTSLDVTSIIIEGTATDPDTEDSLTYRWLEETVEFTLWAPVGANGEAPLDLATILPQYLGIGTHILTLEVSDGQEFVSDEMILVIEVQQIEIDIKPDSENNVINLGSNGLIPVAILSEAGFDATALDPNSITLAGAGVAVRGKGDKYLASEKDVNSDGLVDLEVKIETENLDPGTFQDGCAVLRVFDGETEIYSGSDNITIVPPE